jgi:DNA polymerase
LTRVLHLDFETYASVNLRDVGAHVYTRDPDFTVTVAAWAFDNDPVRSEVYPHTLGLHPYIIGHIADGGKVSAHNASFEHVVLMNHYGVKVDPVQMDCTMQRALVWGLPAGLAAAGNALGLSVVKDDSERSFMLMMGRPRAGGGVPWHRSDNAKLARLEAYCRQDVEAERALAQAVPDLSGFEQAVSLLDARSNLRGVRVDGTAVADLMKAAHAALAEINRECIVLTGGTVTAPGTQTPALKKWLTDNNTFLVNLTKGEVEIGLGLKLAPDVRRVLELRQMAAKSSLKKLDKMLKVTSADGRARGLLQYYGAGRTGRWAGRLIQVQNLPRPVPGLDPEAVIAIAGHGKGLPALLFDKPLAAIASSLRSCLVAASGHVLLSLDLSQIEARVLAWLAGQNDVLEVFRRGEDVYAYAAAKVHSRNRQLGKVLTLACGYGMGPDKFRTTAAGYGVDLSQAEAEEAVRLWRAQNDRVKTFWWDMLEAAKAAIGVEPLKGSIGQFGNLLGVQTVRRIRLKAERGVLMIRKPNGEKLFYHSARCDAEENFLYDGVEQKTGRWLPIRTYGGRFVENVTQAVARDVMAEALLRIEAEAGLVPVMTVHDEAVYEIPEVGAAGTALSVRTLFNRSPSWATDLPVASETRVGSRYGK